ncbi:MAG: sulfur carrier protein ThiS [Muribaculaceae bacterium]|nr:sulfur carrier protein ThiS [Muribaculaceae bacterium]
MKIYINNSQVEVDGDPTVADALVQQNLSGAGIAVAIDNKVVPRSRWNDTVLNDGDRLTVITAVCGG